MWPFMAPSKGEGSPNAQFKKILQLFTTFEDLPGLWTN